MPPSPQAPRLVILAAAVDYMRANTALDAVVLAQGDVAFDGGRLPIGADL